MISPAVSSASSINMSVHWARVKRPGTISSCDGGGVTRTDDLFRLRRGGNLVAKKREQSFTLFS
ncbi:hypothetical protein EYF80_060926 [Liparis tanakae]|uniref:Uncharacterized protein n=1 Tax=Liparis tanakae TaxID=230148 RepID=A0A4Z2EKE5_9TELE|nr:hypothetical protein EYF80_060926 [Liparis tanakae]